ncbi:hypothetical protein RclHR1_01070013 [Rhizophagus clarus]|uniref:HMG box domain-containing protein n=1 Tax=Rhizophagus clarus TaxID=94130 RepID=A0A2Z6Q297_9GLOM|nr:hypothetical protein RclHR1_01070013 [Rhizophagus clarus]GET04827.1 hypothetical protein GLOIN_2v1874204 [Rhizophagus clarus]
MVSETNFDQSNMENVDNFVHEFPNQERNKEPNGFIKYRTVQWKVFKKKYPDVSTQKFSTIAAKQWSELSHAQKNYYIKLKLDKRSKKNKRDQTKHIKKNHDKKKDAQPDSSNYSQLEFNNYGEIYFINQENEYTLLTYPTYPLYYDNYFFYYFFY